MKEIMNMKKLNVTLAILVAAVMAGNAEPVYSDVVGYNKISAPLGSSFQSFNFVNENQFSGPVASVSGSTVTLTGLSGVSANEWAPTDGLPEGEAANIPQYYLEITSGEFAGYNFDIVSNTGSQLTLDTALPVAVLAEPFTDTNENGVWNTGEPFTDTNNNGAWNTGETYTDSNSNQTYDPEEPYTDSNSNQTYDPAATVEIRRHVTLGQIASGSSGLTSNVDSATIFNSDGTQLDVSWDGSNWVDLNNFVYGDSYVIYPGTGFVLNTANQVSLNQKGMVKKSPTVVPVFSGAVNIVSTMNPQVGSSVTLGASNFGQYLIQNADSLSTFTTVDGQIQVQYDALLWTEGNGAGIWADLNTFTDATSNTIDASQPVVISVSGDNIVKLQSPIPLQSPIAN